MCTKNPSFHFELLLILFILLSHENAIIVTVAA